MTEILQPVLVIGSASFIGQAVGDLLNDLEIDWYSLDKRPSCSQAAHDKHFACNILDYQTLAAAFEKVKPQTVLVLAARTDISEDRVGQYEDNIEGTINIINATHAVGTVKRTVFTSTQLVRSIGSGSEHCWEYEPNTTYGDSKVICEKLVRNLLSSNIIYTIVRPTTIWGPRCSDHYLSLLRYIKNGLYFHSGSEDYLKSFGYVKNTAYQLIQIIRANEEQVKARVFYLADYQSIGIKSFCDDLAGEMGAKRIRSIPLWLCKILAWCSDQLASVGVRIPYNSFRLKNITTNYVFDLSETENLCGPLPYSKDKAIVDYVQWFKRNENQR